MSDCSAPPRTFFIGLMSGTSMDGVDAALTRFPEDYRCGAIETLATAFVPFPPDLRAELMALQTPADNEIHRASLAANMLTRLYADCTALVLKQARLTPEKIAAIGVHGQTIRHRPECGYTRQINNPALLAELSGIDVIADFRSRDIAAGGQGAPLVPAFHQAVFAQPGATRVVANIGGMSNISILDQRLATPGVTGFDTGPGNVLMDLWASQHIGQAYDKNGDWAATGAVIPALLQALQADAYFTLAPPKSTGRDLFNQDWLSSRLHAFPDAAPADVQATLAACTATTLANAIADHAGSAETVYVCGGGAFNKHLLAQIQLALTARHCQALVETTAALGILPHHVEALAFAWLAHRFTVRRSGNLPAVTGAQGLRMLGALYPT